MPSRAWNRTVARGLSIYFPTEDPPERDGERARCCSNGRSTRLRCACRVHGRFQSEGRPRQLATRGRGSGRRLAKLDFHAGVGLSRAAPHHFDRRGVFVPLLVVGTPGRAGQVSKWPRMNAMNVILMSRCLFVCQYYFTYGKQFYTISHER